MKKAFSSLRRAFAAASLGLIALPAVAQEAPPAPVAVTAPAAPAMPNLDDFNLSSYSVSRDTRGAMYLCGDNTQSCWTDAEREAGALREFKAMMMSTAFSCRLRPGMENLVDSYDTFMINNEPSLTAAFFAVEHRLQAQSATPRAGSRALDSLETTNANVYAGAATMPGFCETAGPLLQYMATVKDSAEVVRVANRLMLRPVQPVA